MSVIANIRHFSRCIEIAHHIPGRVRLKLIAERFAEAMAERDRSLIEEARQFKSALDDIPGIRSIRVNLLAYSCTVEYDPAVIPAKAWPDFLSGHDSDEAQALTSIIEAKYVEISCAEL